MFIADMHCDSLLTVSSSRGLISDYNTSKKHPFLQFFAAFVPCRARAMEVRKRELMRYLNVYAYECDRLGLKKIDDVRALCSAMDLGESCAMFTLEGGGGLLADSEELFKNPLHPYTKSLLSAIPLPDPVYEKQRVRIIYNPLAEHDYEVDKPSFREITPGHFVRCNDAEEQKYKEMIK